MIDPHEIGTSLGTLIRDHLGDHTIAAILELIPADTLEEILGMIGEAIGEVVAVEICNRINGMQG